MTQTTSLTQSIGIVLVLSLVGLMLAVTAGAADTDTVAATVTPELISVAITSDGIVAYGILAANTSADTVTLSETQTATNDGNVDVDLDIRSSDAVGGTDWNLEATTNPDQYTHEFSTDGSSWSFFASDNSLSDLVDPLSASGTQTIDLRITTPTTSTDSDEHAITVTVVATST